MLLAVCHQYAMKSRSDSVAGHAAIPGQYGPGDRIGKKYQLVELIGAGGMGTVWVAHNSVLDIDVALKLIRFDQFANDPKRIMRRLLQEARAAARLEHPAIVRVFDFGLASAGSPYIVMELLRGESLAAQMAREPFMDAVEAVQLLLPIVDALATAHGRGIIHRDIKPENLFLARDEYERLQPKIVDFGVARFLEGGNTMTRSGALMGTPDYMAPEQARGEPNIDHGVDVWGLSVVLYELVAGVRPFGNPEANYLAALRAIVHDDPDPRPCLENPSADDALWLIIERGLRKNTRERWDTMRVLGEALALWLYERGVREDVLGSSLKANWLQSGLGGVKIETSSMSPPANDSVIPQALPESGRIPIVSAPTDPAAPELGGTRTQPPQRTDDGRLDVSTPPDSHPSMESAPADAIHVSVVDAEPALEDDTTPRRSLFEQTRQLRTLVLASIIVTLVLAIAVVMLLYNQHAAPPPPIVQTPPSKPAQVVPAERAPAPPEKDERAGALSAKQPSSTEEPAEPPEPQTDGAATAPDPTTPEAGQATKEPSKTIHPPKRARPRKKKRYELGF